MPPCLQDAWTSSIAVTHAHRAETHPRALRDLERLGAALEQLPPGRHCFEFRHPSWFSEDVYALLRRHAAALVIADTPERPFQTYEMTADWTFVRFHHGSRGRRGNYSADELEQWTRRLSAWRRRVEVFAYFNNDREGFAVQNALALKRALSVYLGASAEGAKHVTLGGGAAAFMF